MAKQAISHEVLLPAIIDASESSLSQVARALSIPRDALASDNEIKHVWRELPRLLSQIPPELRSPHHARMCIAVGVGLFDAGINYVWNSAITELRNKISRFGANVVEQLTGTDFDDAKLNDLQDAELLNLCLKLNLISEDAFFFLDQCRDIRNNFSTAHPPMGQIDDDEFIVFVKRCVKYALSDTSNPTGVDVRGFIDGLKRGRFSEHQTAAWSGRISETHDAQRELVFSNLHGIYCDPDSSEEARLNAIDVCLACQSHFSSAIKSQLLNRHSDYVAGGKTDRQTASTQFFTQLSLLNLLNDVERHAIISEACARLVSVHQAYNNFYNEPPFASRLSEIAAQMAVPSSCQGEFVGSVVMCAVGNQYGICNAAYDVYCAMIRSFSPQEIAHMLRLPTQKTIVGRRIREHARCTQQFKDVLLKCVDRASVTARMELDYGRWAGG